MVKLFDLWVQRGEFAVKEEALPVQGPCVMSLRHKGRVVLQHYIYTGQEGTLEERQLGNLWAWGIGPKGKDLVWLLPNGATCTTKDLDEIMARLVKFEEMGVVQ